MKSIKDVSPRDVLINYNQMFDEVMGLNDINHFTKAFAKWMSQLHENARNKEELNLSINKEIYLGKKTLALLETLNMKKPDTLRELKHNFYHIYDS